MRTWLAGAPLLIALLSLPTTASADGPQADLEASLVNKEGGGVLELGGTVKGLPDGTKLHVTLAVRGVGAEAAFFVTLVGKEAFKARKTFSNRQFAPLSYVLTVELLLGAQRKATGDYIRREWGLPSGAKVTLSQKQLDIGTLEEQNAFRLQTIKDLVRWTGLAQDTATSVGGFLDKPRPEQASELQAQAKELIDELRKKFVKPFDEYLAQYVVLPEPKTVGGINNSASSLGAALSDHLKGQTDEAKRRVEEVSAVLRRLKEELESRLPDKPGQKKGPEQKNPEQE